MENSSFVNIFLRIRPPNLWETSSPMKTYIDFEKSSRKMLILEKNPYHFDQIYYNNSDNEDVFQDLEPNVDHLMNGYNSCILAYGQSGAGKTFTMGLNEKNLGLISLSLDSLFKKIRQRNGDEEFTVSASYIEIYNEKVYDLLSEKCSEPIHTKGAKYAGSTKVPIENSFEAMELLLKGNKNRHVRSTQLNATSSRSHAMFTITLHIRTENNEKASVLHLIDLAGSEGIRRTNHSGIAQQEGVHINQGLLAVCKVVQALSSGKNLVPYRDSILTTVLQDCLNLESYFTLIACISPARKDRSETLSSIRFAQSCKNLENKMLPEMNAYLKEKQRIDARTPLKPYMLPVMRNDNAKTPGKFGKPSQKVEFSAVKKTNNPNAFRSFITPSAKKVIPGNKRHTNLTDVSTIGNINRVNLPKESIDNNTFNIMNVSCSTEIDGPTSSMSQIYTNPNLTNLQTLPAMPSFSPLMRRIEETIDKKLANFMESFCIQTKNDVVETTAVQSHVRKAIKESIDEVRKSINLEETEMHTDSSFDMTSHPVCSTVIRVPQEQNKDNDQNKPSRRTIRRLMTVDLTENTPEKSNPNENNTSEIKEFSAESPENKTVIHRVARRSTRIFEMSQIVKNKSIKVVPIKEKQSGPTKIKRQVIKNEIVSAYYSNNAEKMKKVSKKDHKAAIMDVINTGTVKDLQLLPTIGAKTAYQIVTHRAIKGEFKTLNDVKKALMMKDKSWEKFLEKNLLNS